MPCIAPLGRMKFLSKFAPHSLTSKSFDTSIKAAGKILSFTVHDKTVRWLSLDGRKKNVRMNDSGLEIAKKRMFQKIATVFQSIAY